MEKESVSENLVLEDLVVYIAKNAE